MERAIAALPSSFQRIVRVVADEVTTTQMDPALLERAIQAFYRELSVDEQNAVCGVILKLADAPEALLPILRCAVALSVEEQQALLPFVPAILNLRASDRPMYLESIRGLVGQRRLGQDGPPPHGAAADTTGSAAGPDRRSDSTPLRIVLLPTRDDV